MMRFVHCRCFLILPWCPAAASNAHIFLFIVESALFACMYVCMYFQCISLASGETYIMTFWWYAASASEGETGSILPQTVRSEFLYYTNSADMVRFMEGRLPSPAFDDYRSWPKLLIECVFVAEL